MAEIEFGKDELNWLHGDDAPTKEDLDRLADQEAAAGREAVVEARKEAGQWDGTKQFDSRQEAGQWMLEQIQQDAIRNVDVRVSAAAGGMLYIEVKETALESYGRIAAKPVLVDGSRKWFVRADGDFWQHFEAGSWNPALHPRDSEGKFVERPWNIADDLLELYDTAEDIPPEEIVDRVDIPEEVAVDGFSAAGEVDTSHLPDNPEEAAELVVETLEEQGDDFDDRAAVLERWRESFEGGFSGYDERTAENIEEMRQAVATAQNQIQENDEFQELVEMTGVSDEAVVFEPSLAVAEGGNMNWAELAQAERKGGVSMVYYTPSGTTSTDPVPPQAGDAVSTTDVATILRHEMAHDMWDEVNRDFRQWFQGEYRDLPESSITEYADENLEEGFTELIAVATHPEFDPEKFDDDVVELADEVQERMQDPSVFEEIDDSPDLPGEPIEVGDLDVGDRANFMDQYTGETSSGEVVGFVEREDQPDIVEVDVGDEDEDVQWASHDPEGANLLYEPEEPEEPDTGAGDGEIVLDEQMQEVATDARDGFLSAHNQRYDEYDDPSPFDDHPDGLAYINHLAEGDEREPKPELIDGLVESAREINQAEQDAIAPLDELKELRDHLDDVGTEEQPSTPTELEPGSTDIPEGMLGPELTETGISELTQGDLVMIDDELARVEDSTSKFITVDRGDGVEELPNISHDIRLVDSDEIPESGDLRDLPSTPEGLQPTSDLEMQRAVDEWEQHTANVRETIGSDNLAVDPIEINDDTYPDGIDFEDGSTLPPRAAAWEVAFEVGVEPEEHVEELRDQGYFVREKEESESGLFEYAVGVTPETQPPDVPEPETESGIPATADLPNDVGEIADEKIEAAQDTYDRFGGDGDFHMEDPASIDWEEIEDPNELADRLIDITPVTGMANESDANSHKQTIKGNLNRMQNTQAMVMAANRLDAVEQDNDGGAVGWNNVDDQRGATANMSLKVSSPNSTVDHETMHAVIDGNGVAYDVNVMRAKRYNSGDRDVSWEKTLLNDSRDNRELWQYMLTDPDADTDKPPGWDNFDEEIQAQFQDLEDRIDVGDLMNVRNQDGPGPNDSWGETMERGDVVLIDYLGNEETLLIDEVNQDAFDDEDGHQVVATRLPGESEQKLKMDDDGNFIFGDDRSHIKQFGQQQITEEDRNPPEVTDPAEELARDPPDDPEERLQEFHEMVNKAWYRQAWASTEPDGADKYKIGSEYSLTNSHETAAKIHEEMTNLDDPDVSAEQVKNWAEKHPGLFRSYAQNFGLTGAAVENILQVVTSSQKYGSGELADGLESLLDTVVVE